MVFTEFTQKLKGEVSEKPGVKRLKEVIERTEAYSKFIFGSGRENWSQHKDYNQYSQSMHNILGCGHKDYVRHTDNC